MAATSPSSSGASRWRAIPLSASLCGALVLACTLSEPDGPRDVDPVEDYRDGGCGAGRKPGTATQTCTYTAGLSIYTTSVLEGVGSCTKHDSDTITCKYSGNAFSQNAVSRCVWSTTMSQPGCAGATPGVGYPNCNAWPPVTGNTDAGGNITFTGGITAQIKLPNGNTLCDPPAKQAELDKFCRENVPANVRTQLDQLCTGIASETKTKEITCCVDKECGGEDGLDPGVPVTGDDTAGDAAETGAPCESGEVEEPAEEPADAEPASPE